MRIGYARVSTGEQNLDLQLNALKAAGCECVFTDQGISGSSRERPGLGDALDEISRGDTLVIWRLDRLGRSLSHLIDLVNDFNKQGIGLHSISETISTTSAGGLLIFHIMGALAEFERSLISERTKAGLRAAKERGSPVGRPKKLTYDVERQIAIDAKAPDFNSEELAERYGISRSSVYRIINKLDAKREAKPGELNDYFVGFNHFTKNDYSPLDETHHLLHQSVRKFDCLCDSQQNEFLQMTVRFSDPAHMSGSSSN